MERELTSQYTSVHRRARCHHTTVFNSVPHRTEGRSQSKRAGSAPGRVPSGTTGLAHNHTLATKRDILTLHGQEGLKGQKYTTRIFQQP